MGRIVAISDLHGAHAAFVETLQSAGVVDASGAWAAGETHLVVVGDLLDRGDDSRASMDFLMRLEGQAAAAGGRVHVVLGNHDVMNLAGDLRYVAKGEFAAFAADETAEMRAAAYARHSSSAADSGAPLTRAEFDARFPPGFFAHRAAFAASGKYGRWLLGKPLALRINETLFVHAGISAALPATNVRAVNGALRAELVELATLLEQLTARGTLDPTRDFYDLPAALGAVDPAAAAAIEDPALRRLLTLQGAVLLASASPLWYRGNVGCGPLVEQDRLARLLQSFGAKRVVIGHTPTHRRQAWRRLGDQVWMIDTGMQRAYYSGRGAALLLEGGSPTVHYQGAANAVAIDELPARAGALSANLEPADLETALATGAILARSAAPGGELLTLGWQDAEIQAIFRPAAGSHGPFPEIAAYRLDRMLDLAMVPAAVLRSLDGRAGTVQHLPAPLVSEARRAAGEVRVESWCPLQDQWRAMHLFDALIANSPRTAEQVQYLAGNGQLVISGHQDAFGTGSAVPPHLQAADLRVTALWRSRLAALASRQAREQLAEVLTKRQYDALLKRAGVLSR